MRQNLAVIRAKFSFLTCKPKNSHISIQIFLLWADRRWVLDTPLQASQPELADERPKKNLNRIFAENIVRCHPEEQLYQVW